MTGATRVCAISGKAEITNHLRALLLDPNADVRKQAARKIRSLTDDEELKSHESIPELIQNLPHDDEELVLACIP
ncbi:MAG: hypothetical protein AAGD07_15050 [Planctomycetota bacterium]